MHIADCNNNNTHVHNHKYASNSVTYAVAIYIHRWMQGHAVSSRKKDHAHVRLTNLATLITLGNYSTLAHEYTSQFSQSTCSIKYL